MEVEEIVSGIRAYDGPQLNIMEVCGSHTGAIAKAGIYDLMPDKIRLISGPGCPVCVTGSDYIDRLIELTREANTSLLTFGDLIRIPGSSKSLSMAKGEGADIRIVYSPLDAVTLAKENPDRRFIFAAVGFETTAPVYALLIDEIVKNKIDNIKILSAIKTMPKVIETICQRKSGVNAFLAPGHVAVVSGYQAYEEISKKYGIPFVVAGFEPKLILEAIYILSKMAGRAGVYNDYASLVEKKGNPKALSLIEKYFQPCDAAWRGLGLVKDSGLVLKDKYSYLDLGSKDLIEDHKKNPLCSCDKVLLGLMEPKDCPLFGKACNPVHPQGACMVSTEGACNAYFSYQI